MCSRATSIAWNQKMHLMTLTKYEFLTKARENFVNRKDEEEEQTPRWSVRELQHKCWGMRKGAITRFLLLLFSSLKITKCISTHFYTFLQNCLYSEDIAYWHSYHAKPGFQQHFSHAPSQAAIVTTWIFVRVSQHFHTLQRSAHSKFLFPGPWGKLKRKLCHYGLTERGLSTLISGSIFFIHFSVHFLW